jgi:NADH-quinone oxidoreductase subunit N
MNLNLGLIAPQISITCFAILVLLLSLGNKSIRRFAPVLSLIGIAATLWFSAKLPQATKFAFNSMALADGYSYFFNFLFLIGTALVILISIRYVEQEEIIPVAEYYSLILFATLGMMLMAGSTDLIVLFLGLELLSISLYILACIKRTDLKGNEAALKYLLLGAFATGFLLYGIALIYGATGTTNLTKIINAAPEQSGNLLFIIGSFLLLIGFGFKVGVVPFHTWIPDVYEGSPTSITAFMAIGPKAAGFTALIRIMLGIPAVAQLQLVTVLWWLAVLTMTLGNIVALRQENIKRMLAYSSIAHAGYILVGLIAGVKFSGTAILFYLLVYTLMNLGAFTVVMLLERRTDNKELPTAYCLLPTAYSGLSSKHPLLAFTMAVFMFSLAGIPPAGGFMAKFYLFKSAVDAGYIGLVIIAVLNSVISVYYYLRVVILMYTMPDEALVYQTKLQFIRRNLDEVGRSLAQSGETTPIQFPRPVTFVLTLCTAGIIYLGIYPAMIFLWIRNLVQ